MLMMETWTKIPKFMSMVLLEYLLYVIFKGFGNVSIIHVSFLLHEVSPMPKGVVL